MVHHKAFTGRGDLSSFYFIHNDLEYGRQVPAKAFQPQFNQDVLFRVLQHVYHNGDTSERFNYDDQLRGI